MARPCTRAGVGAEAGRAAAAGKQLTLQEAQLILGIEPGAAWAEIAKVGGEWWVRCGGWVGGSGGRVGGWVRSVGRVGGGLARRVGGWAGGWLESVGARGAAGCCRGGRVLRARPNAPPPTHHTHALAQKYDHLFKANEVQGSFYLQARYARCAALCACWAGGGVLGQSGKESRRRPPHHPGPAPPPPPTLTRVPCIALYCLRRVRCTARASGWSRSTGSRCDFN